MSHLPTDGEKMRFKIPDKLDIGRYENGNP